MINDDIKNQQAGDNSTNYQAQNLTVVNQMIPLEYINAICEKIVENNMIKYTSEAEATSIQRFNEFKTLYIGEVSKQKEEIIEELTDKFKEPSMQDAFFQAQKGYTKYGDKEKAEKLVQLLIEKGKQDTGSLKDILLDEAIEKLSKLTNNQLNILSYLTSITINHPSKNLDDFHQNYINVLLQFYHLINLDRLSADIQYLMQLGCIRQISFAQDENKIIKQIVENYAGLFAAGFDRQEFEKEYGAVATRDIVIPCLTNNSLVQISALNRKVLEDIYSKMNITQYQRDTLNKFYDRLLPNERISEILKQMESNMVELLDNKNQINNLELMPLGTLIGIKNYEVVLKTTVQWEL